MDELGLKEASRVSARAGASQHQLGTAVDFGSVTVEFAKTKAGKWLARHAREYGFSLSYPENMEEFTGYSWEPWHFRYIGVEAATLELEFFDGVQERMIRYLHELAPEIATWLARS